MLAPRTLPKFYDLHSAAVCREHESTSMSEKWPEARCCAAEPERPLDVLSVIGSSIRWYAEALP
jgi:hypothetical protein